MGVGLVEEEDAEGESRKNKLCVNYLTGSQNSIIKLFYFVKTTFGVDLKHAVLMIIRAENKRIRGLEIKGRKIR